MKWTRRHLPDDQFLGGDQCRLRRNRDAASPEIQAVASFKEKPDLETAEQYLKAGNYLWNAGIFVWNVETITSCITRYKPGIAADMDKIAATGNVQDIFPQCETMGN